jgi:hypothetical protein
VNLVPCADPDQAGGIKAQAAATPVKYYAALQSLCIN